MSRVPLLPWRRRKREECIANGSRQRELYLTGDLGYDPWLGMMWRIGYRDELDWEVEGLGPSPGLVRQKLHYGEREAVP